MGEKITYGRVNYVWESKLRMRLIITYERIKLRMRLKVTYGRIKLRMRLKITYEQTV
jgi:hypothetical protein